MFVPAFSGMKLFFSFPSHLFKVSISPELEIKFPDFSQTLKDSCVFSLTIYWPVATLPVIKNVDNSVNQWKLKRNSYNWQKEQENECGRVTIGVGFIPDWREDLKPIT